MKISLLALAVAAADECADCERDQSLHKEHSMDYQFLRYVSHFNKDY